MTCAQAITDHTHAFREGQRKLQDIDRQLAQRSARLKLLQQLQEKWEGFGEGAKALMQGRLNQVLGDAKTRAITAGLEVQPELAKAFEALLGSSVEAIGVADLATARRILAQLEADQIGSIVLQVGECSGRIAGQPAELPAGLQPALVTLRNPDPAHPAVSLLSACYVADDLNAFLDFWQANPGFSFLAVATRKGEVVDRRGLVSGGFNKKPANSIVQREIDLRETARLLADDQKAHDDQKALIDAINNQLAEAEKALEDRRADVLAAAETMTTVQTELRTAQRSAEEVATRAQRMEHELVSLEQARNEAQARWEKAQTGLTEAETKAQEMRSHIEQNEKRIGELRLERDTRRESLAEARLDLAERRQKVEVLDRGLADMQRRRSQLNELLVQRQQEIEVWTQQTGTLEQDAAQQRARAAQLAETLVVAQQQVEQIRIELVEVERSISGVESEQSSLRNASDSAQGELGRCEVRLTEAKSRAQFIEEDIQREFQVRVGQYDWRAILWRSEDEPPDMKQLDLDEDEDEAPETKKPEVVEPAPAPVATDGAPAPECTVAAAAEPAPTTRKRRGKKQPKPDPTEDDLKTLETTEWGPIKVEIDALRQRLASMGAVNLVAIEEYADLKQRYDFLKTQSDDLTNAKAELIKTIDEINQTSQKQFELTFEQIKKNFEYTFQTLFGGGHAHLELVQTDDVLESGIEIVAQPPGTKLKSITLLSGGQKTLTAVGLLFALYMVKPSPFCLLDELDAPLDESNIGRFTDLLKKFVHESQFIIITHNKRTVSAAKAIYGVTMEERGVSKTVSMRFNADHNEPETQQINIADAVRGAKSGVPAGA